MSDIDEKFMKCYGCKKELSLDNFDKKSNGICKIRCKACSLKHQQEYHKNKQCKSGYCIGCFEEGILKKATFGLEKDDKKVACRIHKSENMIDLVNKNEICISCEEKGKFKRASFGLEEDGKKVFCSRHKSDDMIDLVNIHWCITCKKEGKQKLANFGLKEDGKKIFCSKHKTKDMTDLKNKLICSICEEEGIFKIATFGFEKDGIRLFCSKHKLKEMINLASTKCLLCLKNGVQKQAIFGLKGKKRTACIIHKSDDMIDLSHKEDDMCIGCKKEEIYNKRATFGLEEDGKKVACKRHKTEKMINLADKENGCIICKSEGVFKRASYGLLFEKKTKCSVHKKFNEILKNNPTCVNCPQKPLYGEEKDDIPQRCEDHKKDTDVDMVSRKCSLCQDFYFIPSTLDKCKGCLGFVVSKYVKVKENKIRDLLIPLSPQIGRFTSDQTILSGCSSKRPDFYYPKFNDCFDLVVECDENQHSKYSCGIQGELTRMVNLYEEGNGGFPILFIRFNPDLYYLHDKIIKSYKERENILKKTILGLKNKTSFDMKIGVIYLFYDGFREDELEIRPLDYKCEKGVLEIEHNHPHNIDSYYKFLL
jgi:hypothetical protein